MAINVSINKEGQTSLYVNPDFCVSTDTIHWKELVLKATDSEIICFGILSAECRGVSHYKEKDWKPEDKRAIYRVYAKEKQQYDKETSKYITVDVSNDEALLYRMLSAKAKELDGEILVGNITPWVNPFIYELDATDDANTAMLQKLTSQLVSLTKHPNPHELTQSEIASAIDSTFTSKKGTYFKPETESERLLARSNFIHSQLADAFEFTSLYDLAGQIESLKSSSDTLTPTELLENSVKTTFELLRIIMGEK